MRLRRTCLLFWMLPRSGLQFRRKMSSCCCPAHSPRTHSLLTYGEKQCVSCPWGSVCSE